MENNRIEQIRMVIKLFFSDYDMQDKIGRASCRERV